MSRRDTARAAQPVALAALDTGTEPSDVLPIGEGLARLVIATERQADAAERQAAAAERAADTLASVEHLVALAVAEGLDLAGLLEHADDAATAAEFLTAHARTVSRARRDREARP